MAKELFVGKLSNGVTVELLEAESFSGKTEFAVKVGGEVASVSSVGILRTGDVQVKTTSKAVRVKANSKNIPEVKPEKAPTLDDVAAE